MTQVKYVKKFLSPSERKAMRASFLIITLSLLFLLGRFYIVNLQAVPVKGGEYSEALIGSPKRINPLYSNLNSVDRDLGRLVYSSILKTDAEGNLANDLAESLEIGSDNKSYIFKIRTDAKWHNGSKLTVDDILFTFRTIKNAEYKSPLRSSFAGVEAEKIGEETIKFTLAESYAPFLGLLTFGIMPENLWDQVSPQGALLNELNLKPIGSGPFKFKSLSKDKNGRLISYALSASEDYYGARPNVSILNFKFFQNYDEAVQAMNDNAVSGLGYLSKKSDIALSAKNSYYFYKLNYPELTAIFFNQKNNQALADVKVRQALALALDKNEIIKSLFDDNAKSVDGPILPDNFAYNQNIKIYRFNKAEAEKLLDEAGWKITDVSDTDIKTINETVDKEKLKDADKARLAIGAGRWRASKDQFLAIKLATVENNEYQQVVEQIKKYWEDLNIKVEIDITPANQMQAKIIKPRNFEALFYAQITGNDPDVYAFWHSSQAGELGANIADYSNKEADQLLEDGRVTLNQDERAEKYRRFQEIITNNLPAIFMYSPSYIYAQNKNIKGFNIKKIQSPDDRFSNIADWYIKTKKRIVW